MALSPRQQLFYEHRCDLWRPSKTVDPDTGKPQGGESYALAETDVACYFEYTPNLDTPTVAGRIRSEMLYTIDHIHFGIDTQIDADWCVVNRTVDAAGVKAPMHNNVWKVKGDPQQTTQTRRRRAEKQMVLANLLVNPPLDIAAYYADS